jgi:PAS domain S-box-containing protein
MKSNQSAKAAGRRRPAETRVLQLNRLLRTISAVNQLIVRETDRDRLLRETCRILVENAQFRMAWVGFMDPASGWIKPAAAAGVDQGYTATLRVRWDNSPEGQGPMGTAIRTGQHVVFDDVEHHPGYEVWRTTALAKGYRSSAAFPLRVRDHVVGVLSVYADTVGTIGAEEIALLDELAMDLGYALQTLEDRATRERAETALAESEERFRAVVEAIPDLVWLKDAEGVYLACNRRFERFFGAAEDKIVGRTDYEFVPRELANFFRDHDRKAMAAGGPTVNEEWVTFASDGHRELLETIKTPMCDPQGRLVGVLGVGRDITGRKQVEEALRNSEAILRSVFLAAPVGISIVKDRVCKHVNTYWCKYFGYADEEIVGKDTGFFYESDEEYGRLGRELYGDLSARGLVSVETRLRRRDGVFRDVVITAAPISQDDLSAGTVVITHDITENKRAAEALRESELRYRTLADSGQALIWTSGLDKKCDYFNQPWLQFTGRTLNQELGDGWVEGVHPEDLERCVQTYVAAFDRHEPFSMEYRLRHVSGEYRWLQDNGMPRFDREGQFLGYIGHCLDITGHKQAEAEREKLQAQLNQAQKMESIGRLAGGVAHDFNNMLAAILGHAELALEKMDPTQPIFEDLQEIQKAAERSADLTRQLLAFARKQTVSPRVLDLNATVAGMLKMLRRLIREGIELVWLPGVELGPVKMDPSQLDQILANLAVNARDAIGGVGTFSIATQNATLDWAGCVGHADAVPGEYVVLLVSDTGCGMTKEVLAHLFEPFFTTKGIGEGTGLGLATVYGIIRQNHGFVTVDSLPGHGTTFTIYLPRYNNKAAPMQANVSVAPVARGRETILLVEDEPVILNIVTTMLERLDYTVLAAATPGEAIRLARERHGEIHLLMTDVVMPEMNGRDLAKNLLSLYPNLKRLFMSGYTADVIAHHGVLDEGVNFIQKPFSKSDLAAKLREVLDGR